MVVQVKLSLDSDSEENEESTTTIKMLKRRVRCFATKPQNPLRERHSTVDSKASLLPADKGKEKRSGEDKGAVRKRPMDNNKQPGETETKKQARIGDGIGSGRGRKPQKSAHNGGGPMRSDASAEDRREVDGSSEDPPGGTASGTEARRSSGGGGKRAGGNADETGSHERLPPTAAVKRVRLSKEEHMAALPGFGLQLGTTASIEVKWIVELGKGKCEVRSPGVPVLPRNYQMWQSKFLCAVRVLRGVSPLNPVRKKVNQLLQELPIPMDGLARWNSQCSTRVFVFLWAEKRRFAPSLFVS